MLPRRPFYSTTPYRRPYKSSGGQARVGIQQIDLLSPGADDQLLAVNEALDKLAAQDPTEAELVKLRYFVGLTTEETARLLDISPRTARNYWAHARTCHKDRLLPDPARVRTRAAPMSRRHRTVGASKLSPTQRRAERAGYKCG